MRWRDDEYVSIVTRRDLRRGGFQAAQIAHAAFEHAKAFGPHDGPLLVHAVDDEAELLEIAERHGGTPFHEPDLGGAVTAVAVAGVPSSRTLRLL